MLCGLAKTSELLTKKGNTASSYLLNKTELEEWYYSLARKEEDLYFIKLNTAGKYVFRLEINNKLKYDVSEVLSGLQENSKDPVFLGYPYGLVEADKFARVSLREQDMLKLQLRGKLGKDFEKLKPYLNSTNAHDVLDNIG